MEKKIEIYNKKVSYFLKKSNRAKRMRIAVYHDGKVIVVVPKYLQYNLIKRFLVHKSKWINSKLSFYTNLSKRKQIKSIQINNTNKNKALLMVKNRLKFFKLKYKFEYNQVSIKNQKTIWGSCSSRNNLSFNFKILLLKPNLRDYIIVHELCHLRIRNHSRKFWILVETILPDYRKIKEQLSEYNLNLF